MYVRTYMLCANIKYAHFIIYVNCLIRTYNVCNCNYAIIMIAMQTTMIVILYMGHLQTALQ